MLPTRRGHVPTQLLHHGFPTSDFGPKQPIFPVYIANAVASMSRFVSFERALRRLQIDDTRACSFPFCHPSSKRPSMSRDSAIASQKLGIVVAPLLTLRANRKRFFRGFRPSKAFCNNHSSALLGLYGGLSLAGRQRKYSTVSYTWGFGPAVNLAGGCTSLPLGTSVRQGNPAGLRACLQRQN